MARSRKPDRDPKKQIGAYPPPEVRPKIYAFADTLGRSDGDFVSMCAEAICMMVESKELAVPQLVTTLRVLRQARAGMDVRPTPFPVAEPRDIEGVSNGYPAHKSIDFYPEIMAGRTDGVFADVQPEKIDVPAGVAAKADFAVKVCGDSMEPLISDGEVAVFRTAEIAPNGRIVAALVEGQMVMKMFKQKNGGPAMLQSLNASFPHIRLTKHVRIQGIYEGKFNPLHL